LGFDLLWTCCSVEADELPYYITNENEVGSCHLAPGVSIQPTWIHLKVVAKLSAVLLQQSILVADIND